jgi:cytochrome c oxidase subunit 2
MEQAYAKWWLPADFSTHGGGIDAIINFLHVFMVLLFVGWGAFMIYCLVKFRARPGHKATYAPIKAKPSKGIEIVVVLVEFILLFALSIPLWGKYRAMPATPELSVRIIAQQFQWNSQYAGPDGQFGRLRTGAGLLTKDPDDPAGRDDILLVGELYLPYAEDAREVKLDISTVDVIHSFYVPVLRIKQDAVPGMSIPIKVAVHKEKYETFVAENGGTIDAQTGLATYQAVDAGGQARTREVEFEIACAQLCGINHYSMRGRVFLVDRAGEDFYPWLRQRKNLGPPAEVENEDLQP